MKKYVIAGSHRQFVYYFPKPDRDIIYVHSIHQLIGQRGGEVVRVGTWSKRPDLDELEREVAVLELRNRINRSEIEK